MKQNNCEMCSLNVEIYIVVNQKIKQLYYWSDITALNFADKNIFLLRAILHNLEYIHTEKNSLTSIKVDNLAKKKNMENWTKLTFRWVIYN